MHALGEHRHRDRDPPAELPAAHPARPLPPRVPSAPELRRPKDDSALMRRGLPGAVRHRAASPEPALLFHFEVGPCD